MNLCEKNAIFIINIEFNEMNPEGKMHSIRTEIVGFLDESYEIIHKYSIFVYWE